MERIHIMSRGKRWAIKKEHLSRASRIYNTRITALCKAIQGISANSEIFEHCEDGSIYRHTTIVYA